MRDLQLREFGRRVATFVLALFVMAGAANAHWQTPGEAAPVLVKPPPPLIINISDLSSGLDRPSELKCCSKAEDAKTGSKSRCMSDLTVLPCGLTVRASLVVERPDAASAASLNGLLAHALLRPPIST